MRLLVRDLQAFKLYKAGGERDSDGGVYTVYSEASGTFYGNIQPWSERNDPQAYGIQPQCAYVVYTPFNIGFRELDRIGVDGPAYEIVTIQSWHTFVRLLVKRI